MALTCSKSPKHELQESCGASTAEFIQYVLIGSLELEIFISPMQVYLVCFDPIIYTFKVLFICSKAGVHFRNGLKLCDITLWAWHMAVS